MKELKKTTEQDNQWGSKTTNQTGGNKQRSLELVNVKNSEPPVLDTVQVKFTEWRSLVEDHAERIQAGYKAALRKIRETTEDIHEEKWQNISMDIDRE